MPDLLVSVRGPVEAIRAAESGAGITDVEYPASALGTPYPLNVLAVREALDESGYDETRVSTNIGEKQHDRASACQAALGVATAGADVIKFGLAELPVRAAGYLSKSLVRTVERFYPAKKTVLAVFADPDLRRFLDPFTEGRALVAEAEASGILVDTFNKLTGQGLLDYCSVDDIRSLTDACHEDEKEVWVAGSLTINELPELWTAGVDVVCVRGAACESTARGRFGEVSGQLVRDLVATIPGSGGS
jgi:(5-formylfuran-3-yl)methyl phosphate synthase